MLRCAVGWDDFSSRSIHFFIYLFLWEFAAKPFLRHLFSVSGELILSMSNSHDLCMKKKYIVTVIYYTKPSKGEDAFLLFAFQRIHPEIIYFLVLLFTPIKTALFMLIKTH